MPHSPSMMRARHSSSPPPRPMPLSNSCTDHLFYGCINYSVPLRISMGATSCLHSLTDPPAPLHPWGLTRRLIRRESECVPQDQLPPRSTAPVANEIDHQSGSMATSVSLISDWRLRSHSRRLTGSINARATVALISVWWEVNSSDWPFWCH